jgi:hypothetical protein
MIYRVLARSILVLAQSSTYVVVLGYLIFRSQWVVVPAMISIALLVMLRCSKCGTSFRDPRIYGRFRIWKSYDTKLIDDCPVCHRTMF